MPLFSRYLLKQLTILMLAFLLVSGLVVGGTQSLRFIDWIVNHGLPFSTFLWIVLLVMPSLLTVILPLALFATVLFVYNKLQNDSEIVVMRAAGASPALLVMPALLAAAMATVAVYAINLYLLPVSHKKFKDLQFDIRNNYVTVLVQDGVFSEIGPGLVVYVSAEGSDGELRGLLVQDEREAGVARTWIADSGMISNTPDGGPRLVMRRGNLQERSQASGKVSFLFFDSHTIELGQLVNQARTLRPRDMTERSVAELLTPSESDDPVTRNRFFAEAHQRLASPLAALAFTLMALAAILACDFSRRGQLRPILLTSLAVIALQALSLGFGTLTARNPLWMPLLYLVYLAPICLAAWWLGRAGRPQAARRRPADRSLL